MDAHRLVTSTDTGGMRDGLLLCELHAHTTWSDGTLSVTELVDLYGEAGFDVLCVTDHLTTLDDPMPRSVDGWSWPAYLDEIERERERALDEFGLLVIPGVELTENRDDPDDSAHALALGLRRFVTLERGIVRALLGARAEGAAIVAAHPYAETDTTPGRPTRRFARETELFTDIVDRWELANRKEIFGWVAERRLPLVATGDFHRPEDLSSWKTLIPCPKTERSVVMYLRSVAPVYVMPFRPQPRLRVAA